MILPTKHVSVANSLLGAGAKLLDELGTSMTVSALWERTRTFSEIRTFERFSLTLTFLYSVGALELSQGIISRIKK